MNRTRIAPFVFLTPFLLVFATFILYPLVQSVILSTEQTYGPEFTTFVGWDNYRFLFEDPRFHKAFINTLIFALGSIFLQLPIALGLALLLNQPWLKGRAIYRLIVFSPALIGTIFVGVLFGIVFQKRFGLLNQALHFFFPIWDLDFAWLEHYIMPAIIIASLWMWCGYNMVYFLAALQNVSKDLLNAAKIDGANAWHRFIHVVLPAIRPIAGFIMLISIIGSLQVFELPYLMLGATSGIQDRGLTLVMYLYQTGFETNDLGYASAIGWVLAIILILLAMGHRRLSRGEAE